MKSSNKLSFCNQPWSNLFVRSTGRIQPCCMNSTNLGNIHEHSLDETWNNKSIQNIRKLVSEKKYLEAGCSADCSMIYNLNKEPVPYVSKAWEDASKINIDFHKNIQKFKNNIMNKKLYISNTPITFDIQPNESCNMSCIMCHQNHDSKDHVSLTLINKLFVHLSTLYSARFQGGEIFIYPKFTQFLIELKNKLSSYQYLSVITNGSATSLDELKQLTDGVNPIHFIISMDSTKKQTYEHIRQTPHFDKVLASITYLSEVQKTKQKDILLWSFVVMKSNFYHIKDAILLANKLNIELRFQPIIGYWPNENIFDSKDLREEGYIKYIDICLEYVLKKGTKVSNLQVIRDRLAN